MGPALVVKLLLMLVVGPHGLPSVGNLQKPNRTNPRWLPVPWIGFSWKFTGRRGGQILTCNPMLRGEATMICPFTTSYAYHCLFCSLLWDTQTVMNVKLNRTLEKTKRYFVRYSNLNSNYFTNSTWESQSNCQKKEAHAWLNLGQGPPLPSVLPGSHLRGFNYTGMQQTMISPASFGNYNSLWILPGQRARRLLKHCWVSDGLNY